MPRPQARLTEEQLRLLEEAKRLHYKEGLSWKKTAETLGVRANWIRWRIDPAYRTVRLEYANELRQLTNGLVMVGTKEPLDARGLEERLALIPPDTRDLTGKLMGDPIRPDPRRQLAGVDG